LPTFTYLRKLQLTLLLLGVAIVMCITAAAVRLCCCQAKGRDGRIGSTMRLQLEELEEDSGAGDDEEEEGGASQRRGDDEEGTSIASPAVSRSRPRRLAAESNPFAMFAAAWLDFRARVIHSVLIVLCVFYLRITILLFSAFPCSLTADPSAPTDSLAEPTQSLILDADGQTKCFSGEHAVALPFIILLLLFYTAGLPLGCFILLTRAFADEQTGGVIGRMWRRWACLRGKRAEAAMRKARASEAHLALTHARPQAWPQQSPQQPSESEPGAVRPPSAEADRPRGNSRPVSSPTTNKTNRVAPSGVNEGLDGGAASNDCLTLRLPSPANDQWQMKEHHVQPPPLQKVPTLNAEQSAAALRTQLRRELLYGFLFLSYREATFATGPLLLLASCCVAAVSVFTDPSNDGDADSSRLRLFLFGLLWTVQTLLTAHYLPYHSLLSNGKQVLLGLAALAHTILMLGLQSGAGGSAYFIGLLILFALVAAGLFLRQAWLKRHKPNWTRQKTNWMRTLQAEGEEAAVGQAATDDKAALALKVGRADDGSNDDEGANSRGEGDADHLASPSRRYELQGDATLADLRSPSAASSSDVCSSSPRDGSRPATAELSPLHSAVRPASSSSVSVRLGTPSGIGTQGSAAARARWSAKPLYAPDEPVSAHSRLPQLTPPRSPMLLSTGESAGLAGQSPSSTGSCSPRRISGAVQLAPLQHRRTTSAASAVPVKIHLPPIVAAAASSDRPASADAAAPSSSDFDSAASAAATAAASSSTVVDESATLNPNALPPLRKPPRILLVPVARAPAVAPSLSPLAGSSDRESVSASASPRTPTAAAAAPAVVHRRPSLLDVDGVLDEHERQQMEVSIAHERERTKQMQRARRAKEQRKRAKMEAAAAAAQAAAATEQSTTEDIAAVSPTSAAALSPAVEDSPQVTAASAASAVAAAAAANELDA
jgi:hypothetical protein